MTRGGCFQHSSFLTPKKYFHSHSLRDPSLYAMGKALLSSHWSEQWQWRLHKMDVYNLLYGNCGKSGKTMEKLLIGHQQAGFGTFVESPFEQCMLADFYYGCSAYADFFRLQNPTRKCGKWFIQGYMEDVSEMIRSPPYGSHEYWLHWPRCVDCTSPVLCIALYHLL